jgi:NADPH-dependent ferric siderophore reductase
MSQGTRVITLVAVAGPEDEQFLVTSASHHALWVHRPEARAADPADLVAAARALALPQGRGFVWIAAEAGVARALKAHFLDERGHPAAHIKSSGYWVSGHSGTPEKSAG